MSSSEDSSASENSAQGMELMDWVAAYALVIKLKYLMDQESILVNLPCPIPKLTGAQWMQQMLCNPVACRDNFRMSRDAFLHLHDTLLPFGLPRTDKCDSIEALGMYVWTCAHQSASRECKYRFERSLDTVSRKISAVADVMFRWAHTVIGPADRHYAGASQELSDYSPWFDGCISAIDGTHVQVEVNRSSKLDFINRNGETSINICGIVDMDGRFTFVGAGKAGACHDVAVLSDYQRDPRFPHPPPGRYYLADSWYTFQAGYMTPFRKTRYHAEEFVGVDLNNLQHEEKFNKIHSELRNIIERRFGVLKERWHILDMVPYFRREKQAKIIISCFAMDNYLWKRDHPATPPYTPSEWVSVNRDNDIKEVREWIATMVWGHPLSRRRSSHT